MKTPTLETIINHFKMTPHPEGGYYAETYRSDEIYKTNRGDRSSSTAIYFLLGANDRSKRHRLKSDEIWHFHLGAPVEIICTNDQEEVIKRDGLSNQILEGHSPQIIIRKNTWFEAHPL